MSFRSKYANAAKSASSSSATTYLQPTIYEKPLSPTFTEGVDRNTGSAPEILIFVVSSTSIHNRKQFQNPKF